MAIERTPLSSLEGATISSLIDGQGNNYVWALDSRGQILFQVSRDDIFDKDGNRFEDDV